LSLTKINNIQVQGFTLIEALVSLSVFAIAFSGLYLFFGMATLANNNTEKRMHLNLMSNHIIESIAAESTRSNVDVLNPFVTPTSYSGSLNVCSIYVVTDIRRTWCDSLVEKVGPYKNVSAEEARTIEIFRVDDSNNPIADGVAFDNGNLIVNVILVVDSGSGASNLVSSFFTRKIRR